MELSPDSRRSQAQAGHDVPAAWVNLARRQYRSPLIGMLRAAGALIPGDRLKTLCYRSLIAKPRRFLREALTAFYRIDQIYEVLEEAQRYQGELSILEFGTHHGYAFTKMLYATEYMHLSHRVTVHAFDSFEGLPPSTHPADRNLLGQHEVFAEGQYRGDYAELEAYWIDCDYYSSTRTVIERMLPLIPSGCVIYFDDYQYNYGSRLTGEARVVWELNRGDFGPDIELVKDRQLGRDSDSVYRLVRLGKGPRYPMLAPSLLHQGRQRTNDSALP